MRMMPLCPLLLLATSFAREWAIVVQDEDRRGLAGAQVEAVLMPPNDPRLSSVTARRGQTDAHGVFRFESADDMLLVRARAGQDGRHDADADQRHGLGRLDTPSQLTLTLPRRTEAIPLHYREVALARLPMDQAIGFDAEAADAVPPWGRGKVVDFTLRIDSRQVGWTESAESLASLRRTPEGARMDDVEWAQAYGRFEGRLRLTFPRAGDGIVTSPAFWPYCRRKMPATAPLDGYEGDRTFAFDTYAATDATGDFTGYYLRLRTRRDAAGRIVSARYAKIHGGIEAGPGRVAFRLYYNPTEDDRRLVFALNRNLLRPPPGATPREQERFQTSDP